MITSVHNYINNNVARFIFILAVMLGLSACQAPPTKQNNEIVHDEYVNKGDILPINTITTLDGEVINIHQLGKRKLIVLFATWCDDSNRLLTALNTSPLLEDDTIEIVAISREESQKTVIAWRDKHHIKVTLATDVNRAVFKKFASGGIPRVITVGENNKIIAMNLAEIANPLEKIVWK